MKNPYVIFSVVAVLMFSFLYFYPADIFEIERANNQSIDVTLSDLISKTNSNNFSSLRIKGWFFLVVFTIGIPAMIAWRSTLTKYSRKTGEEKKSVYDKLKK